MTRERCSARYWIVALTLVLLAFALRLWGLTATSLWYDETFMLYHVQQGVVEGALGLLREDNALPLHGLLLALWVQIAGSGAFAARYLSVLLGAVTVPLVLRLGGVISGRRHGGWGAALACATLPINVYYAQEVRMYALAAPLAAGFAWAAWRVAHRARGTSAYVVLGVAMMAAHLYAGLLWAAMGVWSGTRWIFGTAREAPNVKRHTAWWRANALLAVAALPLAGWALWRARVDATAVSAIPASAVRWVPIQFGVGQYLPEPWASLFTGITALSLIAALAGLIRARRGEGALWIALVLATPVALLLAATFVKAKWSERYLLPSFGLALVVGAGLGWEMLLRIPYCGLRHGTRSTRYAAPALGMTLLSGWLLLAAPALARQAEGTWAVGLTDEWHPRPDFRGAAHYIEANDAPGDAIVVIGGYAAHTLDYYYDGPAHLFGLPPDTRLLDTRRSLDLHALGTLEREAGNARRLWLVLWQANLADPTGLVQSVLIESCRRLPVSESFTNVGVLLFDLADCRPLDRLAVPPHPLAEDFVAPVRLAGYDLLKTGETWEVDLWWQTTGPLPADYRVFVHLLGPEGAIVAQHDHIAGADAYPTRLWSPGTYLRDRFFLQAPGGVCKSCTLFVGLYTEKERLPLRDGRDGVKIPLQDDSPAGDGRPEHRGLSKGGEVVDGKAHSARRR